MLETLEGLNYQELLCSRLKKKKRVFVLPWVKKKLSPFLMRIIIGYIKPKRDKKYGVGSPSNDVWKSRVFTLSSWMQAGIICWNCSNPTALKHVKLPLQSMGSVHAEELLGRACKCLTLIVWHIGAPTADWRNEVSAADETSAQIG